MIAPRGRPNNLTGVICNVNEALDKLWWNLQKFEHALSDRDGLGAPQGYAFIDYAMAESALHAWAVAEYIEGVASGELEPVLPASEKEVGKALIQTIKWSAPLRAIANSAKHAREDDSWWPGGTNKPVLHADPELAAKYPNFLTERAWAHLLDSLVTGGSWYESHIFADDGQATPASAILPQNFQSWQDTAGSLGLLDR